MIVGWIIQERVISKICAHNLPQKDPLFMQLVLSPIICRLFDIVNRGNLSSMPPLIAFVESVISAKAGYTSTVGGGILIGNNIDRASNPSRSSPDEI